MRNFLKVREVRRAALLVLALIPVLAALTPHQARTPQTAVDELLAADRAFSAASARTDLITGITAMLASDVLMGAPGGTFAEGPAAIAAALRRDSLNATSRAEWTPVRGGISADGTQGFTYGYMTVTRGDGSHIPLKYLSYWVRGEDGWRVAAYRRGRRPEGQVPSTMLAPALPERMVPPSRDAALMIAHRLSVAMAEKDFSDDAQVMGLGPAFAKWGSADAMNLGGPNDTTFVLGNEAIGRAVGGATPSAPAPIHWSSEKAVFVASSGDLAVSIGVIRPNTPPADGRPAGGSSFFTVWRRAGPGAPWRYVAE